MFGDDDWLRVGPRFEIRLEAVSGPIIDVSVLDDERWRRAGETYDPNRMTPEERRYIRCNAAIGMQSCNLPLGHGGSHEHLHCCLICGCAPCICNKVSGSRRQP